MSTRPNGVKSAIAQPLVALFDSILLIVKGQLPRPEEIAKLQEGGA